MKNIPLNQEQRIFAEKNHNLVLQFLHRRELPIRDYYDVVVFGYLKAVRDYWTLEHLQAYSFSTICWRSMQQSLSNHYRSQLRKDHRLALVSLDELPQDLPASYDPLEQRLLMCDLSRMLTPKQMKIFMLRAQGYGVRKIAHDCRITMKEVQSHLDRTYTVLKELYNLK